MLNGTLLKQDTGIIYQRSKRLASLIDNAKHRHDLNFIADICLNRKRSAPCVNDLIDHIRRGPDVIAIIHRYRVAFVCQLQRCRFANPPARAGH